MRFNFTATENSISMYFGGRMCSIPKSDSAFPQLFDHLKLSEHDYDVVERLINKPLRIARLTEGAVTVVGATVYYRGEPVHTTLTMKLLSLLDMGFDVKPWARFMENVMRNPSEDSRNSLYDFLEHWQAPITEDGYFLAFKRVGKDYMDLYSHTFDNSPGKRVEIEREKVDPDRNNQCSYGLHVAATSYLNQYRSAAVSNTVVCKVNPADVIAVPADYKFAKMRVTAYDVLGDAQESDYNEFEKAGVVTKYDPVPEQKTTTHIDATVDPDLDDLNDAPETEASSFAIPEDVVDNLGPNTITANTLQVDGYVNSPRIKNTSITPVKLVPKPSGKLIFTHKGITLTKKALKEGVKQYGQRGYSRLTGIPRTTLQDWLARC